MVIRKGGKENDFVVGGCVIISGRFYCRGGKG